LKSRRTKFTTESSRGTNRAFSPEREKEREREREKEKEKYISYETYAKKIRRAKKQQRR